MKMKRGAAVLAGLMLILLMLSAFAVDVDNKDKVAIFNGIEIPEGITVNGDAVAIFGDITVNGDLAGDAVAIFGNVSVTGTADRDVVAIFGKISVKDNGRISGDTIGILGGVEKSPNASIRGEIVDINSPFDFKPKGGLIPRISFGDMIGLVIVYAFSCIALLIAPDRIRLMAEKSKLGMGRHFGIGFVIVLLFIPASIVLSVLLAITLVGIIFIPFIFIAFALLSFVGMVALEVAIGHRITGRLEGRNSMYIYLMVGAVLVYTLKMIPIFGWLAYMVLVAYGIGVAVDTRLGSPAVRKQVPNV